MSNKYAMNWPIASSTNTFSCIWKLTRLMKAAGWSYKASGIGTQAPASITKDTSGTAANDIWGGNADPTLDLYSNISTYTSGTTANINTFAGAGTLGVNSTSTFPTAGVIWVYTTANSWQLITYSSTTGGNTFAGCNTAGSGALASGTTVVGTVSTTQNSGGAISLPQGTITVSSTTGFPASGTIYVQTTASGSSTMQAVTYTGTTGTTFTGCSGGTGTCNNTYVVAYGGATIGLDQVPSWIVLSGPQTLKIPLNAAPTGTFLRGETITQATSAAEGELLGYIWDSVGLSGWAAVLPRTGNFDMTTAHTITGQLSSATMSPLSGGTMITWNREVMFYKNNTLVNGYIYYICADSSGESAQLYSALAAQTGCTGIVQPGGGGTNNAFPAKGISVRGLSAPTPNSFFAATTTFQNYAQICATNCTPATGVSTDGTFYCALAYAGTVNYCAGFTFQRLDDTEAGDCDPFVFMTSGTTDGTVAAWVGTTTNGGTAGASFQHATLTNSSYSPFFGYQSRGNGTVDVINAYIGTVYKDFLNNTASGAITTANNLTLPIKIVNSPASTKPLVLEPIMLYTNGVGLIANSTRQYKGKCRWLFYCTIGNLFDTYSNKTLFCVAYAAAGTAATVIGPMDSSVTSLIQ